MMAKKTCCKKNPNNSDACPHKAACFNCKSSEHASDSFKCPFYQKRFDREGLEALRAKIRAPSPPSPLKPLPDLTASNSKPRKAGTPIGAHFDQGKPKAPTQTIASANLYEFLGATTSGNINMSPSPSPPPAPGTTASMPLFIPDSQDPDTPMNPPTQI